MSKQVKPIRRNCQAKDCVRDAVWGLYRWNPGETDVNLDQPGKVVCGQHKFKLWVGENIRAVKLRTK